jgi:hypothetical protein
MDIKIQSPNAASSSDLLDIRPPFAQMAEDMDKHMTEKETLPKDA